MIRLSLLFSSYLLLINAQLERMSAPSEEDSGSSAISDNDRVRTEIVRNLRIFLAIKYLITNEEKLFLYFWQRNFWVVSKETTSDVITIKKRRRH